MIVFDQDQGPSGSTTSLWQHPEATVWRRIKTGRCIARLCWQLGTYTCNNSRTNLWFWVNSFLLSLFFLIEPMITCMVSNALQWSVLQPVSYEESQSGWGLRGPQVHLVPPLLKQGCSELVPGSCPSGSWTFPGRTLSAGWCTLSLVFWKAEKSWCVLVLSQPCVIPLPSHSSGVLQPEEFYSMHYFQCRSHSRLLFSSPSSETSGSLPHFWREEIGTVCAVK